MAGSVNKVILIGNLGADPDFRTFNNGGEVANLRLATSETWTDKQSGERQEKTEWHSISVTGDNLINVCKNYLRKGMKVYIEGQLQTRTYDKDGQTHYRTDIALRPFSGKLEMLDSRNSNSDGDNAGQQGGYQQGNQSNGQNNGQSRGNNNPSQPSHAPANSMDDFDDAVPF